MTQTAIATIRAIPGKLRRRSISGICGTRFNEAWAENLICYFCSERAAASAVFPASIELEGIRYNGFIEVSRDGFLQIRLKHGT